MMKVKRKIVEIKQAVEPIAEMAEPIINPIKDLADSGRLAGILLLIATAIAMTWSNLPGGESFAMFWDTKIGIAPLEKTLNHWINDGLMVIFFFFVGLEIKRELLEGELSSIRQAVLPGIAAIGGAILPATLFVFFNRGAGNLDGWAIPTATDIAFSLGVLSLLGDRVPFALKVLLTAIAVIDDLIAVLVIALFYTKEIELTMLLYAGGAMVVLGALNYFKVRRFVFYLLPGLLLWFFILKSGVHATIAGVLLAMTIPLEEVDDLEHILYKPVSYLIMPIFALANTAIALSGDIGSVLTTPLSYGIVSGLFLGKPLGIVALSWVVVKLGWAELPKGLRWRHIFGLGFTAGIGFTMSIFITNLSFEDTTMLNTAKVAIMTGTLLSAVVGLLWLIKVEQTLETKRETPEEVLA